VLAGFFRTRMKPVTLARFLGRARCPAFDLGVTGLPKFAPAAVLQPALPADPVDRRAVRHQTEPAEHLKDIGEVLAGQRRGGIRANSRGVARHEAHVRPPDWQIQRQQSVERGERSGHDEGVLFLHRR
jgi:hypothetical protein